MKKLMLNVLAVCCIATSANTEIQKSNSIYNDTIPAIDNYLQQLAAEKNFSGGLLIIQNGKKIFSKGYGYADRERKIPFTPGTLASIGSITKAFTATAILKLAEQNKVSLNDPLRKFFPSAPDDKGGITIHQLLTHSSGFREFLNQDGGDYEKINTEDYLKRAFAEPLAFKPGEKAVYTNVGYSILGIIIEKVSKQDYEEFLRKNLFEPLGIKNLGYHYPVTQGAAIATGYQNGKPWGTHRQRFQQAGGGPYWNLKANGGLEASLDEMFLWLNSFTNHTVLQKSFVENMFTPHIAEEGYGGQSFFGYGCNIGQSSRNTKVIDNGGSNGVYFARMIRYPDEGVVFYMVTNESSVNANMVLPNITQLYFFREIRQDAMTRNQKFESRLAGKIYGILVQSPAPNLDEELKKENIIVDDDMILLEVGQALMQENKIDKALILYLHYTKTFPNIVVAWNDMGDIYLTQKNKEEAKKCYERALKIRPQNPRAREALEKLK